MIRAVFLDRDGVLNRSLLRNGRPFAPTSLDEFELLAGVEQATRKLHDTGFRLIVVTNQPDVGAGRLAPDALEAMHRRLLASLPLDEILVCPHLEKDRCDCRKPKPGMLLDAARRWSIALPHSFMVGDRWRDVSAGRAAGCKTIFIDYHYGEAQVDEPDYVTSSLIEAVTLILGPEAEPRTHRLCTL
jgi:D-glycero-D-manno-heptose 1,7-bisphosphate phosphatase